MFKEGLTIAEISQTRSLTPTTIEGHLALYIEQGLIDIGELISVDKIQTIEPVVRDFKGGAINPIKEKLGDSISYGEIRLMLAWLSFKRANEQEQASPVE